MKYILSLILLISSFILNAQDFYINVQTGYGLATPDGQTNYYNVNDIAFNSNQEVVKGGFGEGLYFRLHTGYNYNDLISFECGFNYLRGQSVDYQHRHASAFDTDFVYAQSFSQRINAFIFSPQLVLKIPTESKFKPYAKTGIAVGLFMKGQFDEDYNSYYQNTSQFEILIERELEGGTPLGFTATLGTQYQIYKNLIVVVDCSLLNMTYRPYKNTITKYIRDGSNDLNDLSLWERETLYVGKIEDDQTPIDMNASRKSLPISLPMSNVSFNVGLQVNL